jgi:hypothetical protein
MSRNQTEILAGPLSKGHLVSYVFFFGSSGMELLSCGYNIQNGGSFV